MSYWGDFPLGETLNFLFTTRSFSTGAPTVLAGTPVLSVYEDTNLTQITSGVTVTVDHDSVVGLNRANVVATSGNGYETGKSYNVVLTTGTVAGVSVVGEVVGIFTIERSAALRPTTAGRTLDVTATGAAGIDWGNVENPTTALDLSGTDIQLADTVTTNSDMRGTDAAALASVCTEVRLAALTDWINGGRLDLILDIIAADVVNLDGAAMRGTDSAALASVATEARLAELDAGNIPTDLSNIQGATFSTSTDSLEAIRDRGDAAWVTAAGFALATICTEARLAELDAANLPSDNAAITAAIAALNDISLAAVNAEMVDVMATDTVTLPGQGAPPLTPTRDQMNAWLYKTLRNRKRQTSILWELLADNETTVDAKATISDDGTTTIKQEIVTGP